MNSAREKTTHGRKTYWQQRWQIAQKRYRENWQIFAQNRIALLGIGLILIFATFPFLHSALRATVWSDKMYDPIFGFDQNSIPHPSPPSWMPADWLAEDDVHRFDQNRPSFAHLLGTDTLGRDVLSTLLASTAPTFIVGLTAAFVTAVIGLLVASYSSYYRGWVDGVFSHISDAFMLMPAPIFLVAIGIYLQTRKTTLTEILYQAVTGHAFSSGSSLDIFLQPFEFGLIYGIIAGLGGAAIVLRSHGLKVMSLPYIEASRVSGGQSRHIIQHHLIPHMIPLATIYTLVIVTGAVVANGFLSFFGLNPNPLNWGTMIYNAFTYSTLNFVIPWAALMAPAVAISLFAAAFYMVSRGLNQVVDPHLRADFYQENSKDGTEAG